jgi:hypothetical protein
LSPDVTPEVAADESQVAAEFSSPTQTRKLSEIH